MARNKKKKAPKKSPQNKKVNYEKNVDTDGDSKDQGIKRSQFDNKDNTRTKVGDHEEKNPVMVQNKKKKAPKISPLDKKVSSNDEFDTDVNSKDQGMKTSQNDNKNNTHIKTTDHGTSHIKAANRKDKFLTILWLTVGILIGASYKYFCNQIMGILTHFNPDTNLAELQVFREMLLYGLYAFIVFGIWYVSRKK